jgi:hypothetical protein
MILKLNFRLATVLHLDIIVKYIQFNTDLLTSLPEIGRRNMDVL